MHQKHSIKQNSLIYTSIDNLTDCGAMDSMCDYVFKGVQISFAIAKI